MPRPNPSEQEETVTDEAQAPPGQASAPSESEPLLGAVIDGRFRMVSVIGHGAMGKVFRAVQQPLNRAVAIKILDSRYGAGRDESFRQRFLVEAALTAKLSHPNTVRVLDYGTTAEGLYFLAMEYLDGETLEARLARGPLQWQTALAIGQQLARALGEAHELGVVHRDLKPSNVMLLHGEAGAAPFAKVLDFGLVKSFVDGHELEGRAITKHGMLMGSPPYMAPEQGEKNRSDPRSDIYSLGTLLFEMLTGKPPFVGGSALEVILKHVHEPVPLLAIPTGFEPVPPAFLGVLATCLEKSPMDRFQSMDEFLAAVHDVGAIPAATEAPAINTDTQTEITFTPTPIPFSRTPISRFWILSGLAVVLVAGLALGGLFARPASTVLLLHLASVPPGATVYMGGTSVGITPMALPRPPGLFGAASVDLRFEKEGYAPAVIRVKGGSGDFEVSQTLVPLPAARQ